MPQALFEHFFKMADNQHMFFAKISAISFSTDHMYLWNSAYLHCMDADINKVHLSLIEISVVQ